MNAWDPAWVRPTIQMSSKPLWKWIVFGDPQILVVHLSVKVPLWRRIITRILLGSKWTKL